MPQTERCQLRAEFTMQLPRVEVFQTLKGAILAELCSINSPILIAHF
jgi:hypothetical protein